MVAQNLWRLWLIDVVGGEVRMKSGSICLQKWASLLLIPAVRCGSLGPAPRIANETVGLNSPERWGLPPSSTLQGLPGYLR